MGKLYFERPLCFPSERYAAPSQEDLERLVDNLGNPLNVPVRLFYNNRKCNEWTIKKAFRRNSHFFDVWSCHHSSRLTINGFFARPNRPIINNTQNILLGVQVISYNDISISEMCVSLVDSTTSSVRDKYGPGINIKENLLRKCVRQLRTNFIVPDSTELYMEIDEEGTEVTTTLKSV